MKKINCLLMLFLSGASTLLHAQQEPKFSATDVREDLRYLYHTLEKSHYNLCAYVGKSTFDSAYSSAENSIGADSLSYLDTNKLFQRFIATGNVGHNEVDFPVQSYIAYALQGGGLFPLELAFEGGKTYIRKNYTATTGVRAGVEVLRIDGVEIDEIKKTLYPYISAERPYFKDVKIEFWSFPRLFWLAYGQKQTFSVTVQETGGALQTFEVNALSVMDYEQQREGEILQPTRAFNYFQQVAYLRPGTFSAISEADSEPAYRNFIDSVFADLESKNVDKLIIDLRNNAGGHNAYSDYLIAYIASKPFRWYSSFQLKASALLKEQTLRDFPLWEKDAYARAIMTHADGETFAYDFPLQEPVAKNRFTGKVVVLVNRQTYSMAVVSAALIQDYGFATLVGEETGDIPTLYASRFTFPLPKTGIPVHVPKGYMVRPNGSEVVAGVLPNVQVRDHLLDEQDEQLSFVLDKMFGLGK